MSKEMFNKLFKNELSDSEAKEFLVALYNKGESSEDIANAASVMREHSIKLPVDSKLQDELIDIVGTGGDKSGSFNISTTVSLLLASVGSKVAKHGNRSITSNSGSADVLEALGINLNLNTDAQIEMLKEVGWTFIFAMNHHPAMGHIMPVRKSLTHRTIFNILGPLTNPAGAKKYLLGVFSPEFIDVISDALIELDTTRAFVVSSRDGMDEISISSLTDFAYIQSGRVVRGVIDPEVHGFKLAPKEDILGGSATDNAKITRAILSGELTDAKRDVVLLNGAYALFADGKVKDIKEGIKMLEQAISSGKAIEHLERIIEISNSF
jgi:anthranilate phosphoribosyltransferase